MATMGFLNLMEEEDEQRLKWYKWACMVVLWPFTLGVYLGAMAKVKRRKKRRKINQNKDLTK